MAHFAKLGKGNIVENVIVVHNNNASTEQAGVDFINNLYGTSDIWKQTSYNTRGGIYYNPGTSVQADDQTKAFRKNYAQIGGSYDEAKDAFIPIRPFNSWTLNETTCLWEAPVAIPTDGKSYRWNETTKSWDEITVL